MIFDDDAADDDDDDDEPWDLHIHRLTTNVDDI